MAYTQEEKIWLWLASIENVGVATFKKILNFYEGDIFLAKKMLRADIEKIGLGAKTQKSVYKRYEGSGSDQYADILEKKDIKALTLISEEYPELLKQIYDPPIALFCKGDISVLNHSKKLAVVGTRRPTRYGDMAALEICEGVASNGVCIISGMARGIDTTAHKAALAMNAPTIAVLGCGVDVVYPRENKKIYEEIVQNGVVISEYPIGTQPLPGYFPARNRIISGLSNGVLVVEAADKSGTLITIEYAQSQGREVLAVPGNITSEKSKTPNKLIRDGAGVVISYKDILSWFNWSETAISSEKINKQPAIKQLTIQELSIIKELELGETLFDELLANTDFSSPQLTAMLVTMEIKGIVDRLPGNKYALKGR